MGLRMVNYSSTIKEKHVVVQLCLLVVSSWDNQIKTPRTSLLKQHVDEAPNGPKLTTQFKMVDFLVSGAFILREYLFVSI